jgi:hypothetical protein
MEEEKKKKKKKKKKYQMGWVLFTMLSNLEERKLCSPSCH